MVVLLLSAGSSTSEDGTGSRTSYERRARDHAVEGLGKRYRLGAARSRTTRSRRVRPIGVTRPARRERPAATTRRVLGAPATPPSTSGGRERRAHRPERRRQEHAPEAPLPHHAARPTGHARIAGRVGALLEVGTGFHGELTGPREHLPLRRHPRHDAREIRAQVRRDRRVRRGRRPSSTRPVKRYSSGMYVRLAFSVAAASGAGHPAARRGARRSATCRSSASAWSSRSGCSGRDATILFVSHNMFSIKTMCERVIYLEGTHRVRRRTGRASRSTRTTAA